MISDHSVKPSIMPTKAVNATAASGGAHRHVSRPKPARTIAKSAGLATELTQTGFVERGAENPDYGGIHPAHDRLRPRAGAQRLPEPERAEQHQNAGQEDADHRDGGAGRTARREAHDGAR